MKFILAPVIALGLAASTAVAQTLSINTPANAVVCEPLLIMWQGGTAPYFVSILPGNQPNAPALINFPQTSATSLTWVVTEAAETSLGLDIRDSTGTLMQSAPFTVSPGPILTCLTNVTTSISFGPTAAPAPTSAGTGGTSPATTTSPSTPNTATGSSNSGASTKTSSTASSPSKSAGASRVTDQVAVAGIIGAAMIALLGSI